MTPAAYKSFRSYRDLIVYQKAVKNSVALFKHYQNKTPVWTERFVFTQLLRAATSIGANIAEGYGRHSKKDYRRFVGIARGSAMETEYWINLLIEIRSADKLFLSTIDAQNTEVSKILTTFMKNLNS